MTMEFRPGVLPAGLDLGDEFPWEGKTFRVTSISSSGWIVATHKTSPPAKPIIPAEESPSLLMEPAEPAAPEVAEPIGATPVAEVATKPADTAPLAEAISAHWAIARPASEAEALRVLIEVGLEQWRLAQEVDAVRSRRRITRWARVKG